MFRVSKSNNDLEFRLRDPDIRDPKLRGAYILGGPLTLPKLAVE